MSGSVWLILYEDEVAIRTFIEEAFSEVKALGSILSDSARHRIIVIKPNWVQEAHEYKNEIWQPVITNPKLILCLLEFLAKSIAAGTTICVCDAPHTYANFSAILDRGEFSEKFAKLKTEYPKIKFEVLDLRREVWLRKEEVVVERRRNSEDPRGYVRVNLGEDSLFNRHVGEGRFYGADYNSRVVNTHHHGNIQEYLLAGTPMRCDLFINLPKMKTHKKTGITCCLKNLVGINGDKNWLPHHTEGSPATYGDEFPGFSWKQRLESGLKKVGKQITVNSPLLGTWIYRKMRNAGKQVLGDSQTVIRNGNWSGNDTCWRMALDLNRALLYANWDGTWRDRFRPKAFWALVDGIIGGEGNGPLCPDPVPSHVLVSGANPAEVDAVVAKLMGFDPRKIPIIKHAFEPHRWPIATSKIEDITALDQRKGRHIRLDEIGPCVADGFVPHFGWQGLRPGT